MTEKINPETQFIIKIYTFEYYVKFSFWVSVSVNKRLRNLGRIQFIAKFSYINRKIYWHHKYQALLRSWRKVPLQLSSQTLFAKIEGKKLLRKISSKNLSAGVVVFLGASNFGFVNGVGGVIPH